MKIPYSRLLKSVLSIQGKPTGSYEDPTISPGGGRRSEPGVPHKGWYVLEIKEAATWKWFDRHE